MATKKTVNKSPAKKKALGKKAVTKKSPARKACNRRLECTTGGSGKIWEAEVRGSSLVLRWGKLGSTGQSKTKVFPDADAAQAEMDKVAESKLRKGYVEVRAKKAITKAAVKRTPAAKMEPTNARTTNAVRRNPGKAAVCSERDFKWNGYFWTTMVALPSWRGFRCKGRASRSSSKVELVFAPEGRDDASLRESEFALVQWAIRHEAKMQRALLKALLGGYADARERYVADGGDPKRMPPVRETEDLKQLIELRTLNVHQIDKGGIPYVGFCLGCTWDVEHGLGVLLHGTRVVEIGGTDTAILLWIAKRDARKN